MGFIKTTTLILIGILLFISFLILNSFFIASSCLEYNNLQKSVKPLVEEFIYGEFISKELIEDNFIAMKFYCQQNNTFFVVSQADYTLSIPCQEILTGTSDSVVDSQINKFIQDNYYKEYSCSFWSCFEQENTPFFVFSEMSKNYFKSTFYILLVVSLILILLVFFLVEFKRNSLIIVGALLVISSLPFAKLDMFIESIQIRNLMAFLSIISAEAYRTFLIVFILGIILLGIGIGLKIWGPNKNNKKEHSLEKNPRQENKK